MRPRQRDGPARFRLGPSAPAVAAGLANFASRPPLPSAPFSSADRVAHRPDRPLARPLAPRRPQRKRSVFAHKRRGLTAEWHQTPGRDKDQRRQPELVFAASVTNARSHEMAMGRAITSRVGAETARSQAWEPRRSGRPQSEAAPTLQPPPKARDGHLRSRDWGPGHEAAAAHGARDRKVLKKIRLRGALEVKN